MGMGPAASLGERRNEDGYFLAVLHAVGAPAGHQTEIVGSVTQTHDWSDRARTKISPRPFGAPTGNDEPAGLPDIPLH